MRRHRKLLIVVLVLALWEAAYRFGLLDPVIFAAPSTVVRAAYTDGLSFLAAFQVTLAEIAAALALAWGIGIALGLAASVTDWSAHMASKLLGALISAPFVILYPLAVAWLGLGMESKIFFAAAYGFAPISLNTIVGVRAIEAGYERMALAMGARPLQVLIGVLMPLALPSVLSGLRIGTSLVIIGVILGEMLASTGGIGFLISFHRSLFNTGQVYLGILLALLSAGLANHLLTLLERRLSRWRTL